MVHYLVNLLFCFSRTLIVSQINISSHGLFQSRRSILDVSEVDHRQRIYMAMVSAHFDDVL